VQAVLDTVVGTAARLCQADMAGRVTRGGDLYRPAATFAHSPEFSAFVRSVEDVPGRGTIVGRVALERRVVHVADLAADAEYAMAQMVSVEKIRTALGVPLLRDGEPIGVLRSDGRRVGPFSHRQIELVRTFAD